MAEPLTDEEFERIKRKYSNDNDPLPIESVVTIRSLIATIELQKSDKKLGAELVAKIQEVKEERNALSRKLNQHKSRREFLLEKEITNLKEENAKLEEQVQNWKDAVHDYSVALKEKEKEIAELGDELTKKYAAGYEKGYSNGNRSGKMNSLSGGKLRRR